MPEQTEIFENKRWSMGDQKLVFRHSAGLDFVERGQKILDIGCGDGLFLKLACEKGAFCTGLDLSIKAVEKARLRLPEIEILRSDVTTQALPFSDGNFDVVSAQDVLEHVFEPEKVLREINRVTRRYAIICVPNFSSLPSRIQCLFGKIPENNKHHKGHVYWFNLPVLKSVLIKTGFRIVKYRVNHQAMEVPLLGALIGLLTKIWPDLFALSFVVLAEKDPTTSQGIY